MWLWRSFRGCLLTELTSWCRFCRCFALWQRSPRAQLHQNIIFFELSWRWLTAFSIRTLQLLKNKARPSLVIWEVNLSPRSVSQLEHRPCVNVAAAKYSTFVLISDGRQPSVSPGRRLQQRHNEPRRRKEGSATFDILSAAARLRFDDIDQRVSSVTLRNTRSSISNQTFSHEAGWQTHAASCPTTGSDVGALVIENRQRGDQISPEVRWTSAFHDPESWKKATVRQ